MTTATRPAPVASGDPSTLRRLHLARFGFAVVWALALFLVGSHLGPLTAVLLVLYPVVDVAAAAVDARSSRVAAPETWGAAGLRATMAISALAAIGLVVALSSGVPAVLRVWGVWAVVAGIVQLVVAIRRRSLGGQWAMIASGSISVLAGVAFVLMASAAGASLAILAGYALLGGIFFLVSALRLGRTVGRN